MSIAEEKKITPQAKYDKKNTTSFSIKFNNRTDYDIIEKLKEVPSKLGYIKKCIRKDISEQRKSISENDIDVDKLMKNLTKRQKKMVETLIQDEHNRLNKKE